YNAHDADDSVELGMLRVGDLEAAALWQTAAGRARQRYAALDEEQFRRAAVHELIELCVSDLIATSQRRLAETPPASAADAAASDMAIVGNSTDVNEQKAELQRLLFERVYRHPLVLEQRTYAGGALREMFAAVLSEPARLPAKYLGVAQREGLPRAAGDFLAAMTDRFALEEYDQLPLK
ncbi:MAG: metal-dependent phosphohydrolase, partial [Pirellulales bacterium]|nr:metal-dependent phosphohydrolase [Pirellulales bacterium]